MRGIPGGGKAPTAWAPAEAAILGRALHALGAYGHVSVRAYPRCPYHPLGAGQFGLSFHPHTGRWEPMPVVADLTHLAHDLVGLLGPYLPRWDFPGRNRGPDHEVRSDDGSTGA